MMLFLFLHLSSIFRLWHYAGGCVVFTMLRTLCISSFAACIERFAYRVVMPARRRCLMVSFNNIVYYTFCTSYSASAVSDLIMGAARQLGQEHVQCTVPINARTLYCTCFPSKNYTCSIAPGQQLKRIQMTCASKTLPKLSFVQKICKDLKKPQTGTNSKICSITT